MAYPENLKMSHLVLGIELEDVLEVDFLLFKDLDDKSDLYQTENDH